MRPSRSIRVVWAALLLAGLSCPLAAAAQDPPKTPADAPAVADLSTRFRFIERYTAEGVKPRSEVIGQYRVAIRETNKKVEERPQAAPAISEVTFRTIYSERPAQVTGGREVLDTVRNYEAFRLDPDRSKPSDPRPLEGLTLWYHPQALDDPVVMNLSANRSLREIDYWRATHEIFLPDLRGVLPALPSHVGDQWRLPQTAMRALLGDRSAHGEGLAGKLVEVRRADQGRQWVAVISVTGHTLLAMTGPTAVNAQLLFTFAPPETSQAKKEDEGTVDAWGGVTELRMALTSTFALSPKPNERLRQIVTRQIVLERVLTDTGSPLTIPTPAPRPTEANSWLTCDDPAGRFHFRFPQDLQQPPPGQRPPDGSIDLLDRFPEPRDTVTVVLQPRSGKPELDRQIREPEFHRKNLIEEWKEGHVDVVQGPAGWLPENEWAPFKMKVYKMEAVLKPTVRDLRHPTREHLDFYLVLFAKDESLLFMAKTGQDPPTVFSKQAVAILKTLQLGPSKP